MKPLKPLSKKSKQIRIGGVYTHYKGSQYVAIAVARHSETLEELVVYQRLHDDNSVWVRPLEMFLEEIEVNGKKISRFAYDLEQTEKIGKDGYMSNVDVIRATQKFIEQYRPALEALAKK